MTDDEIKEECLKDANIDLGRYSYSELRDIKEAMRRYRQAKFNIVVLDDVSKCQHCENELCDAQKFNSCCFKCGKTPF